MKILEPNDQRKIRGLIARALDEASPAPEQHNSALAVCRLLARLGMGVDGDSEDLIALVTQQEADAPMSPFQNPAVVFIRDQWNSSNDPRKANYEQNMNTLFDDLFGKGGFDSNKFGGRK